jgi:hypothetical protein
MRRREMLFLAVGLVVGLLAGMAVIGTSDDLRTSLFGTATSSKTKDMMYYLVELPTAQSWLAEKYPDDSTKLGDAVNKIVDIPPADLPDEIMNQKEAVEVVLPQMYAALTSTKNLNEIKVSPDSPTSACLGLDDDPYNMDGPILYLYITVPVEQAKKVGIPQDWQKLDTPKTNVLYWQLLDCYPALDAKKK